MPLQLEIVTPEARIFSDEVDSVVLPGFEGELGVLPMHAPLVTTLQPGELRWVKGSEVTELAVGEGLVEITGQSARVLTDMALSADQIDEKAAEEALERAKHLLAGQSDATHGGEDIAAVMAMVQKASAQLKIKRRRSSL